MPTSPSCRGSPGSRNCWSGTVPSCCNASPSACRGSEMLREIAVAGVLVPSLLLLFLASLILFVPLDLVLARLGTWRLAWHPPLARLALFIALWAALAALVPD